MPKVKSGDNCVEFLLNNSKVDMVQTQDRPRTKAGNGSSRRSEDAVGFDPFDVSNTEAVNSLLDKSKETDPDQAFDPFGFDSQETSDEKTNARAAQKSRPGTRRSNSLSMQDFAMADAEKTDDDMEFDAIDWNNGTESPPKRSAKGRSRRHSLDSGTSNHDSDPAENVKHATKEAIVDDKKKKKLRSGKVRRQSLDNSALTSTDVSDDDGFGPVKTYGFEPSNGADRRKGMARSSSVEMGTQVRA